MPEHRSYAWRAAMLVGLVAGLVLAGPAGGHTAAAPGVVAALAIAIGIARPRHGRSAAFLWLFLVVGVATLAGAAIGSARLASIDEGRLLGGPGEHIEVEGTVVSAPRTSGELTRFTLEAADGRVAIEARLPLGTLDEGRIVSVSGTVREPAPWERAQIERTGAQRVLAADSLEITSDARGGFRGALDDVRRRAESALERGTPPISAALLRGFVLGQDDRIPKDVRDDFRRSGLAHVLAVSGQNVMLLAILATPLLALAGVPFRARLLAIAGIIAVYVPVAGAGASIQRAGVMGVAGVVAALASRPTARWYALGLAAAVTLAIDPRATGDIGWQLSFCAVSGLLVLAPALIRVLGPNSTGVRRGLAEGAAMTLAASLATAPLAAHHFGTVSITAIPANLVALPAIAPAMWLGMLSGALGQIPGAPVEPLTWLGGLCAGFIGWVARILGPEWAQLDVPEPGPGAAIAWTVFLVGGARLACLALERRATMTAAPRAPRRLVLAALAGIACVVAGAVLVEGRRDPTEARPALLTIRILDVGQGDAILVEPRGRPPLLIDTGPPEAEVGAQLGDLGVESLFAIAITHDERDHSGGLADALGNVTARRLLLSGEAPQSCRYLDCPPASRLTAGSAFRMGRVRVETVWPPASMPLAENPNETALVLHIRCGDFDALFTADAEAEVASYASGPVDLLKVAHHGSEDAGLDSLLERTAPQLAAVSVGADNPYGHPAPETTAALAAYGVPVVRTDEGGEIVIEVRRDGWSVGNRR
ncbi:MAG: ComEC/Rec2 family competence protein [Actinomycetota bacterium]|nr:ComEC/Rec2 family competence protein [Actinomycetota bacterium]